MWQTDLEERLFGLTLDLRDRTPWPKTLELYSWTQRWDFEKRSKPDLLFLRLTWKDVWYGDYMFGHSFVKFNTCYHMIYVHRVTLGEVYFIYLLFFFIIILSFNGRLSTALFTQNIICDNFNLLFIQYLNWKETKYLYLTNKFSLSNNLWKWN